MKYDDVRRAINDFYKLCAVRIFIDEKLFVVSITFVLRIIIARKLFLLRLLRWEDYRTISSQRKNSENLFLSLGPKKIFRKN